MSTPPLTLAQIISSERHYKTTANTIATRVHAALRHQEALEGERSTYEPLEADGVRLPPEDAKVQLNAAKELRKVTNAWMRTVDMAATKDFGNCTEAARADLVMPDGRVLIKRAPMPLLLWLEANLKVWRNFTENLPVLPGSEDWVREKDGIWESEPVKETEVRKVPRSLVTVEATEHHPAQVHLYNEEEILGFWTTVRYSGALPPERVQEILHRMDEAAVAIKDAITRANTAVIEQQNVGRQVIKYLFDV